jgi:diguanylate cyclase (GGDEF)-like protein
MKSPGGRSLRTRLVLIFSATLMVFALVTAYPIYQLLYGSAQKTDEAFLRAQLIKISSKLETETSHRWAEMEAGIQKNLNTPNGWTALTSEDLTETSKVAYVRSLEFKKDQVNFWILTERKQFKGTLPLATFLAPLYRLEDSPFAKFSLFDNAAFSKGDPAKALLGAGDNSVEAITQMQLESRKFSPPGAALELKVQDRRYRAVSALSHPPEFDEEGLLLIGLSDMEAPAAHAKADFLRMISIWLIATLAAIGLAQLFAHMLSADLRKFNQSLLEFQKSGKFTSGKLSSIRDFQVMARILESWSFPRTASLSADPPEAAVPMNLPAEPAPKAISKPLPAPALELVAPPSDSQFEDRPVSKAHENFMGLQMATDELSRANEFLQTSQKVETEIDLAKATIQHFLQFHPAEKTRAIWIHFSTERTCWLIQNEKSIQPDFLPASWSDQLEASSETQKDPTRIQEFLASYLETQGFLVGVPNAPQVRIFLVSQDGGGRPSIFAVQSERNEIATDQSWAAYQKILETSWVACLRRRLLDQTIDRDPLTNLYNRDYLAKYLQSLQLRYREEEKGYAIILWDIDHFKKTNNKYGQTAGDQILQALGGKMNQYFSTQGGRVCRLGGEEFVVVLPDYDADQAMVAADEFRILIERTTFNISGPGNTPMAAKITLSAGVADCPARTEEVNELIAAADTALNVAKEQGHNSVAEATRVIDPDEEAA